jgi:hypothetical protein
MVAAQFERTELHDAAVSISHSATSVTSLSAAPVQWSIYTTFTWFYSGCSSTLLVLNMEKYESAQQILFSWAITSPPRGHHRS